MRTWRWHARFASAWPGAKAVEDAKSEAWIAFARTGNPEGKELVR